MTKYSIIDHEKRLPHKQTFRIVLTERITKEELSSLTEKISLEYRVASEKMFFNWWIITQDQTQEFCWAHSRYDGNTSYGINLLSVEDYLESVEIRPLSEPNELGLWFWDQGNTSHYIQLLESTSETIEIRKTFLDGSSDNSVEKMISKSPLRIEWASDEFLQLDEDGLTIFDESGPAIKLQKIR